MNKVTPFLTFQGQAEAAADLYTSLIPNSRITGKVPGPDNSFSLIFFELDGCSYTAMNGGETFHFSEGFSFSVVCEDQSEVDKLWQALTRDGGKEGSCGWCTDRFGLSWQIIPKRFMELTSLPDPAAVARVFQAMYGMKKLVVEELEKAARP